MGRRNRECYLCGTDYKYCPTCSEDKTKPAWMAEFHSENCVKIFAICSSFNMDKMSKAEAQAALNACDLSNKSKFRSCVQRDLEIIFKEDPKPKRNKRIQNQPVDDFDDIAPTLVDETIHEVVKQENE